MTTKEIVKSVTIFSTTTCSFCHLLAAWLDKENVVYTKKNTDQDEVAMAEFIQVNDGAVGVPFTVIKYDSGAETKIVGFDKSKIRKALSL